MKYVLRIEEVDKNFLSHVGSKVANLGELLKLGIRVPPGFVVTTEAYQKFMEKNKITKEIFKICASLNLEDVEGIKEASERIKRLILESFIPEEIVQEIEKAYAFLCEETKTVDLPVAVRSSATAEDMPEASFAGLQDTYLWVKGIEEVVEKVKQCWASLFSERALSYRLRMGFPHEKVLMGVGVQKMVKPKAAGILFTIDPLTGDPSKIIVEGSFGLGEAVVSGRLIPDKFVVEKVLLQIVERVISLKPIEDVPDSERGTLGSEVSKEREKIPSLKDEEIIELAKLGKLIEKHFGSPQDIEWAIDKDLTFPENIFILQSRPETVWSERRKVSVKSQKTAFDLLREKATQGIRVNF